MSKIKNHNKEYTLSFVEEAVRNPDCNGWAAGRIEVIKHDKSSYAVDEVRFFTPRNGGWLKFMKKYDSENVDKNELDKIAAIIKEKFYKPVR